MSGCPSTSASDIKLTPHWKKKNQGGLLCLGPSPGIMGSGSIPGAARGHLAPPHSQVSVCLLRPWGCSAFGGPESGPSPTGSSGQRLSSTPTSRPWPRLSPWSRTVLGNRTSQVMQCSPDAVSSLGAARAGGGEGGGVGYFGCNILKRSPLWLVAILLDYSRNRSKLVPLLQPVWPGPDQSTPSLLCSCAFLLKLGGS